MKTNTTTSPMRQKPLSLQRLVRLPLPVMTEYHCIFEEGEELYDTLNLKQNLETKDGDHWLIELNLQRWRSKKQLSNYLRFAADVVSGMPNAPLRDAPLTQPQTLSTNE